MDEQASIADVLSLIKKKSNMQYFSGFTWRKEYPTGISESHNQSLSSSAYFVKIGTMAILLLHHLQGTVLGQCTSKLPGSVRFLGSA